MNEIDGQSDKLVKMYSDLKSSVTPNAKIYIIGYPQIITDARAAQCGLNVRLTTEELQLATLVTRYLNNTIMHAAQQANVQYIDVDDALAGSRLHEATSAAMSVNGITAGKDNGIGSYKFLGNESFHPNEKGHQLLKEAILNKTKGFTHDSSVITDNSQETKNNLLQAPETHRPIRTKIYSDTLTDSQATPGSAVSISGNAFQYDLLPGTTLDVSLDGHNSTLGSVATDTNGGIQATVAIPADTEPGIQAIHLYGKDKAGKNIDIYQYLQIPDEYDADDLPITNSNPDIPSHAKAPNNVVSPRSFSPSALLNFTLTPKLPPGDSATTPLGEQLYVQSSPPHTLGATSQKTQRVGSAVSKLDLSKDKNLAKKVATITVLSIGLSLLAMITIYKIVIVLYARIK